MTVEADLHLHSSHSDGLLSPSQVVARAAAAGLGAIALTDHDTIEGVREAIDAAPPGLEVIPGSELSSVYKGREIHLLLYFIDPEDRELKLFLEPLQSERRLRAERIAREAGTGDSTSLGRPHLAEAIVRHGAAVDLDDAFSRYLRRGQPAFVDKPSIPVPEAVRLARRSGGALVVAHPALNLADADVAALAREGLDGIEVWHPKQTSEQKHRLAEIAKGLGAVSSGGSDYHGKGRSRHEIGASGVTLETVELLRERAVRAGR